MKMPRKPLGSVLKSEKPLEQSAEKTVRRKPPTPDATISQRYERTSKRLQAVEYNQYGDTIYFKLKGWNARTIGYVRLNLRGNEELNIDFLEVYEPFRKKRYGTEIYKWTENHAKEREIDQITVISLEEAVGCWRKIGFKRGVWSKPGYLSMFKALTDS